jgi:hypothetical protein
MRVQPPPLAAAPTAVLVVCFLLAFLFRMIAPLDCFQSCSSHAAGCAPRRLACLLAVLCSLVCVTLQLVVEGEKRQR